MRPCQGRDRGFESRRDRRKEIKINLEVNALPQALFLITFPRLNNKFSFRILPSSIQQCMVACGIDPHNPDHTQPPRHQGYQNLDNQ